MEREKWIPPASSGAGNPSAERRTRAAGQPVCGQYYLADTAHKFRFLPSPNATRMRGRQSRGDSPMNFADHLADTFLGRFDPLGGGDDDAQGRLQPDRGI